MRKAILAVALAVTAAVAAAVPASAQMVAASPAGATISVSTTDNNVATPVGATAGYAYSASLASISGAAGVRAAAAGYLPAAGYSTGNYVRIRTSPVNGSLVAYLFKGQQVSVLCSTTGSDGWTWYLVARPYPYAMGWTSSLWLRLYNYPHLRPTACR
ncbi:hypothetical protein [Alloactinosynnema sp. L-07]|uniref:hypothetical protein n=1 Tax=Alloactinosynnema sp. L-07 TaxID=1653480 RepID=UPI00065F000E|nr:hypothetical protein [Alloactinosynnema sp. L-07]CRK57014.1 hypothetical protein [Alloactinosynnema sp. L-07]